VKKQDMEGKQIPSSNYFSILDNDEIISKGNKMGVAVDESCFHSIHLIKELELA